MLNQVAFNNEPSEINDGYTIAQYQDETLTPFLRHIKNFATPHIGSCSSQKKYWDIAYAYC